jgi:DnaK suppressor protein
MKKEIIEKLKKILEQQKGDLEKELSRFAEQNPMQEGDWQAKFPDVNIEGSEDQIEDGSMARQEYETRLSLEQALESKLRKINKALEKIKKGKYGVCEKCGNKISEQRLKVVPEAEICKKCI